MPEERREQVTRVAINRVNGLTGGTRRSRWKAAAFNGWHEPDKSRGLRPESVSGSGCKSPGRLGLGVQFPGPTRQEETELCQTGLRRPGENLTNCHREAKVTAPLLDSTQNASGPTLGRRGSGVDPHIGSAQCTCAGLLSHVQELEVDGKEVATSIRQFRKAVWLTWILQWPYSAKTDRLLPTASAATGQR